MPFPVALFLLSGLAALISPSTAQTWTACNPLNSTGCPLDPALGTNVTHNLTSAAFPSALWNASSGTVDYIDKQGAIFKISGKGDSPTVVSNFYIFFGRVEVVMRAAQGVGVVSAVTLQSDDLDEVDWEWVGGNTTHVQSNYFGKGDNSSYDRAIWHQVETPQELYHNYTTVWTAEEINMYIDDRLVRTLTYGDARNGSRYPQTPMNVRIGVWAGGDPDNDSGTIQWSGGEIDYHGGPYIMTVKSVYIKDFSAGAQYQYGDQTGTWQSIKILNGTSAAQEYIQSPHGVSGHWDALPTAAKVSIVGVSVAAFVASIVFLIFCCIRQRRLGRQERALADAEWDKEQAELRVYQKKMANGEFAEGSRF